MPDAPHAPKRIHVLMYGGTIDGKSYKYTPQFIATGEPPQFITPLKASLVPPYLKQQGYDKDCVFTQLEMKDSQNFTASDMNQLIDNIKSVKEKIIVVTFGTDGMADNAKILTERHYEIADKTIIFTGAMEPLSHGRQSDGYDNVELAIQVGLHAKLSPGVYAAIRNWENEPQVFVVDDTFHKIKEQRGYSPRYRRYFAGTTIDVNLPEASGVGMPR